MSELIRIPTVEQINLEHQLANSKASEAVQHATNCGLMLLQVKASLNHGEWLPWLNGEIESGRLKVKARQTRSYMQLASNWQRDANLVEAPSIRAALELLSDKEPAEQQGTLIDVEAERKAREEAEVKAEQERQARELEERRSEEWKAQWKGERDKAGQLQTELDIAKSLLDQKPEPVVVEKEVIPDDYETAKSKAAKLETELADLKKRQDQIVNDQVRAKLQERQQELQKLEDDRKLIEDIVARKKAYLDSLDGEVKRVETHQSVINGVRLELIGLAAFLSDLDPIEDRETVRRWLGLAGMLEEAASAIRQSFTDSRPLTVIPGGLA